MLSEAYIWIDLGLQVLDSVVMTRWKVLPREQCQGRLTNLRVLVDKLTVVIRNTQLCRQFHHPDIEHGRVHEEPEDIS